MTRILVVDDEAMICELVADTLRDAGYTVDTAPNGAEALERMSRHVPDAIVLDLMMPRLDATGLVACMRTEPHLASIPILVVTASYAAQEAADRLGARACLTKPFELEELVAVIGRLLDRQVGPATSVSPARGASPLPTLQSSVAAEA